MFLMMSSSLCGLKTSLYWPGPVFPQYPWLRLTSVILTWWLEAVMEDVRFGKLVLIETNLFEFWSMTLTLATMLVGGKSPSTRSMMLLCLWPSVGGSLDGTGVFASQRILPSRTHRWGCGRSTPSMRLQSWVLWWTPAELWPWRDIRWPVTGTSGSISSSGTFGSMSRTRSQEDQRRENLRRRLKVIPREGSEESNLSMYRSCDDLRRIKD